MKVIFLDVDGVLNKHSDYRVASSAGHGLIVNNELVDRLLEIIKDTGAKLVLSSSWRILDQGEEYLNKMGLTFIGKTDTNNYSEDSNHYRGSQIQRWLDKNDVEEYVILDDDSDMLFSQLPNFIQTDPEYGITETIKYRVTYRLLNGPRHKHSQ